MTTAARGVLSSRATRARIFRSRCLASRRNNGPMRLCFGNNCPKASTAARNLNAAQSERNATIHMTIAMRSRNGGVASAGASTCWNSSHDSCRSSTNPLITAPLRNPSLAATVVGGKIGGITANLLATGINSGGVTLLEGFTLGPVNATDAGESTYGLYANDSDELVISKCTVYAGSGMDGLDGVVVRTPFDGSLQNRSHSIVPDRHIEDGMSKTLLVGEKCMNEAFIGEGREHDDDDAGYVDGWDWDVVRWGYFQPSPDYHDSVRGTQIPFMSAFGSSHPGAFNAAFCDGSVRPIRYSVELEVFEHISARNDREIYDDSAL